ncbi:MAG TPA: assimilatory sulfite reductase (NADPH) flavoprotein subunit [Kiritimatiellia bacterium]|nr:assimilatory sulfite reductase (NADPH) flavoprotein subunit [Kiritimatiellia bacterium]HMO97842.1 assimilatory sulfite reductase (NADPH) flavoprotein subunit [Kiritimatiellia bacterium]HMP97600.1 assimilatory sulfite reductase (NADPH) flavoprotein subunit [Kiritimatiellia bacterium]
MNSWLPDRQQTPLNEQQYGLLQQGLASLNPQQLAWVGGYLSGLTVSAGMSGAHSVGASGPADITILVGSQTGNGEKLAQQLHDKAASRGLKTAVRKMGDYKLPQLKTEKHLLVIVSTHGEGEPPDNTKEMYEFLHSKRAPSLKQADFAVLGLGDSSYEFFCKMGVDFDKRLEELGAKRLIARVDCDVDYDDPAERWMEAALTELAGRVEVSAPSGSFPVLSATPSSAYSRKHPFPAALLEDIVLNGRGSDKETHHIELSLEGSGLAYEPGDALGVYPVNAPDVVDDLLAALKCQGDETVTFEEKSLTLREAFSRHLEITTITRPVMKYYAALAKHKKLDALLDDQNKQALNDYLHGREIVDLVSDFPVKKLEPQALVSGLRKLPPRLYSIASSLKQHPDEVHLTVAAVRYQSFGRNRKGVCSTYLADRIGEDGTVPVYVDANSNFKLPGDPSAPVIMIGPGTGIAPFRAFIEEREAIGATGKNWLFFGDQHFMTDFLYQAEWLRYLKSGLLTRMNVAFSRDQAHKVYVQHRMAETSRDLYQWLQDGAYLYVCGDEKRMAHDVHEALIQVVASEGALNREQAEEYVKLLQKDKRYQRDVY